MISDSTLEVSGIPHFTGSQPGLMKEYRRRVLFAYNTLEGEGDTEAKEKKDLERKQRRFGKRLLDALHGEAWRACQELLTDMDKLKAVDGYKHVFVALQQIEKVTIVKKTEQFDKFFERGFRKRGQPLDQYLRLRKQDWADLKDLDENTSMSDDLVAYFVLKQCNLSKEDRRQILLNNASSYDLEGIEKAMRVSFYDIHEREKIAKPWDTRSSRSSGKGRRGLANYVDDDEEVPDDEEAPDDAEAYDGAYWGDEIDDDEAQDGEFDEDFEGQSDAGASNDDEVFNAYKLMEQQRRTYKDSRRRLKDIQKARGFFKGDASDDRKKMNDKEKERSRCSACDRIGHWAGDPQCPKSSRSGPKKFAPRSKGKDKGRGKKSSAKAYYVADDEPRFFTLGDPLAEDEHEFCNMVRGDDDEKKPAVSDSEAGWSYVSGGYVTAAPEVPMPSSGDPGLHIPGIAGRVGETRQMPVTVTADSSVRIIKVKSLQAAKPKGMDEMTQKTLRECCDKWDIQVSGSKDDLKKRLSTLFMGLPVARKGCSRQFIKLEESESSKHDVASEDVNMKKTRVREEPSSTEAAGSGIFRSSRDRAAAVVADLERRDAPQAQAPLPKAISPVLQTAGPIPDFQTGDMEHIWSSRGLEHAYTVRPDELHENSGDEPKRCKSPKPNSTLDGTEEVGKKAPASTPSDMQHQLCPGADSPDESRLGLLDTACTSCMHSRAWREAYSKHLPPHLTCQETPHTKSFTFADGSSTNNKMVVWRIPLILGGHRGEVYSAEVVTGNTPLLLSIPAMEALDMAIFLNKKEVQLGKLGISLPLVVTRTKHLAIDLLNFEGRAVADPHPGGRPICQSEKDDLFVYLTEEASYKLGVAEAQTVLPEDAIAISCHSQLKLGHRGILPHDKKKEISQRRADELEAASSRVRALDNRCWVALRRSYTFAEQLATCGFTSTVIFEPFGGTYGITRVASQHFGWTNSQPLDLLDGYDLLSKHGKSQVLRVLQKHRPYLVVIAFDCRIWSILNNLKSDLVELQKLRESLGRRTLKLVLFICKFQDAHGRYYLVENPASSLAWVFDGIPARLLDLCHGKYIVSDQCRYGLKDAESGRPVKKPTGFASNGECLLNHLGKRCRCPFGAHQPVLGSNKFGKRSVQAASYPFELCRAVCHGVLETMKLDYAIRMPKELSFLGDDDAGMDTPPDFGGSDDEAFDSEPEADSWEKKDGKVIRHHVVPRQHLFTPKVSAGLPCQFHELLPGRTTFKVYSDGRAEEFTDEWTDVPMILHDDAPFWTGRTEIACRPPQAPDDEDEQEPFRDDGIRSSGDDGFRTPAAGDGLQTPAPPGDGLRTPGGDERVLRRRKARSRQLQRGFWMPVESVDLSSLLQNTLAHLQDQGGHDWQIIPLDSELGARWYSFESANAEVTLVFASLKARRLRKPQPHASPLEVPLRKAFLFLQEEKCLTTSWEEWRQLAPSSQTRPLVAENRKLCVITYGKALGEVAEADGDRDDPRLRAQEVARQQKWDSLPRELKLALKRVHINLGHAPTAQMLRAMRLSRASEVAIRACRLFRCPDCPRIQLPKKPRPSKLPLTEEFNVEIGLDLLHEKDANGHSWSWLNILCQGTTFQICVLLPETNYNPTAADVLQAFEQGWTSWAGYPERGVFADRAKYFFKEFSEAMAAEGCYFDTAAKASPWQIGQVERHGDIWKNVLKRLVWAEQLAGKEMMIHATSATNQAKNSLARKSGFSPMQWVLGRSIRLPADLTDDAEAVRLGALALSTVPTSRFYMKSKLRFAAREAFVKTSNSEALKRAELSRGPFPIGSYVFYYDAADKLPGPACWRGVARVIGSEGSHTIWLSHRGLLLAVSPEHLSHAFDDEVKQWTTVSSEMELLDAQPGGGGTGFIDLRSQPKPPAEGFPNDVQEDDDVEPEPSIAPEQDDLGKPEEEPEAESPKRMLEDLSSDSTSMDRIQLESLREEKRQRKSYEFFDKVQKTRLKQKADRRAAKELVAKPSQAAEEVPVPEDAEFDPERDDYHQAAPSPSLPTIVEDDAVEAQERAAKRLRLGETEEKDKGMFSFLAVEDSEFLHRQAADHYLRHQASYESVDVTLDDFLFGVKRNRFDDKYQDMYEYAMGASVNGNNTAKKKGRKEIALKDLSKEQQEMFTGAGGSDAKEWKAWQDKEAVEVLDAKTSRRVREEHPELIIPTRWALSGKNDGVMVGAQKAPFLAKSRLVVQGFKDKSLGYYRRDAPTASAMAESICLAVVAYMHFILISKDVKNAYFSGKSVNRDIYLEQPRTGLPGLARGQLLKARKAIYGFSEAARMFWLALKEHLESDGWEESRLEPALFYLREGKILRGILVTHVDDLEGGVHPDFMDRAFQRSGKALEYATNHCKEFIFRGREMKQTAEGHVDVCMRNYALSMKTFKIDADRRKQLESPLTSEEMELYQSSAGELGWISRQLRCDLAYENGVVQRSKSDACIADLIRLKQYVGLARRGADFKRRYWSDVNLSKAIVILLSDSGHANGTPERNELVRYRSVGGYFLLVSNPEIMDGQPARANILGFHSGVTKRVCRSTLAAEASHLAEAVEAGDWCIVLLEEALTGDIDLRNWPEVIQRRKRVYVTDARSVYDYLHKDATSTSADKRMAIEGALLRETVRQKNAFSRWIDGMQNIANVLTKSNAEKDTLREFLRSGVTSLVQSEKNKQLKEKKKQERQKRSENAKKDEKKAEASAARRKAVAKEIAETFGDESEQDV
eukprot:Skav219569  [mRNA]  locus=scaffold3203:12014:25029:+ [translate_table: standard]